MKGKEIYRIVRTYPFTDAVYSETGWHTSYKYCRDYLDNMNPIKRQSYNYIIEKEELIEDKTIEELVKTIQEYQSILGELYEDGDEYEEIPMYEELLKESKKELNNLKNAN